MKAILLFSVIASSVLLFNESVSAFQLVQRRGTTWVGLKPDEAFRLRGCELAEEEINLIRKDYIKRKTDKRRILFYTHGRSIMVTVAHRGHLVLINDNEASKSNKVMTVNLDANQTKQIDLAAIKMYRRNASPDGRLWIVPNAYAFSPDDKQVLITMELIDISARTPEESIKARRTYKRWWYVVDSSNGEVEQEYRTNSLPRHWWLSNPIGPS